MSKFIIALDQGTTSSRAVLIHIGKYQHQRTQVFMRIKKAES